MMGEGAMSSGAYKIPAISSAWSVNGKGGRCGGASGLVLAARSVAVRSSNVSVSTEKVVSVGTYKLAHGNVRSGTALLDTEGDGITARVKLITIEQRHK